MTIERLFRQTEIELSTAQPFVDLEVKTQVFLFWRVRLLPDEVDYSLEVVLYWGALSVRS